MEIPKDKLKQLLSEAFDRGYDGCREFRDEYVDEIITNWQNTQKDEGMYRIYKVAELKELQEGTLFNHSTLGRCWIVNRQDGIKLMQFQSDNRNVSFIADSSPWDKPMMMLYSR